MNLLERFDCPFCEKINLNLYIRKIILILDYQILFKNIINQSHLMKFLNQNIIIYVNV